MSLRIEQDSKLLTMPRSQRSPPMSFSDPSTWEQMFQELIQEEKPRAKWTLQLDKNILPDNLTMGWRQYQQAGVGRFQCSICNRYWVSAQVKILCHMNREPSKLQGRVLMRIFAQRCQKCSEAKFENPGFSEESIQRVLEKLVSYILQKYYGHGLKKITSTSNEGVLLDGPHDRANCEACTLDPHGGCAYKAKPLKSPSPPPKSCSSFPSQSHGSSPPKSHGSFPPQSHCSFSAKSLSSSAPQSHSSYSPKSHGSSPPKSHSSFSTKSHSSSPPQSHGSSPPKSHSSPPPQSLNFLSQPASTYSENVHVQEHRELNIGGLFAALSLGAIILFRLIFL
ncbi:receptor-transporting protein 4 isoform X2 [Alexandromys fortis]|nr:receptor-transporting protein 4 isoform X2 [Microtus fortis]XP_050015924.1 receptor-transporting protein 4 isoform X2 [Microtus fortis]